MREANGTIENRESDELKKSKPRRALKLENRGSNELTNLKPQEREKIERVMSLKTLTPRIKILICCAMVHFSNSC